MSPGTTTLEGSAYESITQDLERRQSRPIDGQDREANLTEEAAAPPVQTERRADDDRDGLEKVQSEAKSKRTSSHGSDFGNENELSEVAVAEPRTRRKDEEQAFEDDARRRSTAQDGIRSSNDQDNGFQKVTTQEPRSHLATEIYIHTHLILFSIFGILARLGLEAITTYPGAPAITPVLWPNFAGSLIFGFLSEDQRLFREEWGISKASSFNNPNHSEKDSSKLEAVKKKHLTVKKTIPLYIGLTTGFCGSFTSFSSFMRDAFLALSNDLHASGTSTHTRNNAYSLAAVLAIPILEITISISGLIFGAHLAILFAPVTPILPFPFIRKVLDPLSIILGIGCWIGAIFLAIFPPHNAWRGEVVFALVFGPFGCLLRFYLSKHLNSRLPSFPLGTFIANILGTIILGTCCDLQHSPHVTALSPSSHNSPSQHNHHAVSLTTSCQILQGLIEGFCGALTTVSTWVAELNGLRRRHAYIYGGTTVVVGFCSLVVVAGSVRWSGGSNSWSKELACKV